MQICSINSINYNIPYFKANYRRGNGFVPLQKDTVDISRSPKSEIKEHVDGMKHMLWLSTRIKKDEAEKMLIKTGIMEMEFANKHPDYCKDYRPFLALGDFYMYKNKKPKVAIGYYDMGIDALCEFICNKKKQNISSLKQIANKCKDARIELDEYYEAKEQYSKMSIFEKMVTKPPYLSKEVNEYFKENSENVELYRKATQLAQMFEGIEKAYLAMGVKKAANQYKKVAKDFRLANENADIILKRRARGQHFFMDIYDSSLIP